MRFEDLWDKELDFGPDPTVNEKNMTLVRDFFDKAWEKINHFDRLRQQQLNYALVAFSGLLAFIINTHNTQMQYTGCAGIALLMAVFCLHDHRLHKYTHGFSAAMILQAQALRDLTNEPNNKVSIRFYRRDAERDAAWWKSHHTRIYCLLIVAALVLGVILRVRCPTDSMDKSPEADSHAKLHHPATLEWRLSGDQESRVQGIRKPGYRGTL